MSRASLIALTVLAMIAFAGNSLLCRLALRQLQIDAASFTAIRLVSGAAFLWLVLRTRPRRTGGSWTAALALVVYAAAFSFAYLSLAAGTGALLLFVAVQGTMVIAGLRGGERLHALQWLGVALALVGLVLLLLPGIAAPPIAGAILMLAAGVAWGIYSLRGRGVTDAIAATAGNFLRAAPIAVAMLIVCARSMHITAAGATYALASGAITSGLGYVLWYSVLPSLKATSAATVQLSAPVIAAVGGVVLLDEAITLRMITASTAILGGIALAVIRRRV